MKQNAAFDINFYETHPVHSSGKAYRQAKKDKRYRKLNMHRLKSTHLLTAKLIEEV